MMPTRVAPAGSTTAFACEDTIHLRHTGATPVDCSLSCRHYRLNASLPQHSECDRDFAKQCPLSTPTGRGLETSAQLDAARLLTRTLAAAFARHNVSYWLDFGALAGSVRYGGQAIAARGQIDDVDIGVLLHEHAAVDAAVREVENELRGTSLRVHGGTFPFMVWPPSSELPAPGREFSGFVDELRRHSNTQMCPDGVTVTTRRPAVASALLGLLRCRRTGPSDRRPAFVIRKDWCNMTAPFRRMRAFDEVHPPELRDGMIPRTWAVRREQRDRLKAALDFDTELPGAMETRRLGPLLAFSSPAQTRQLRDLLCRDDGPPKHATGCRHTHPAHKYSMKVVLGWNNASAAGERNGGFSASRKGVFAEVTFWVHWGDALLRFPCSVADVELPAAPIVSAPRSRVRFLGSELLAPADAHAFLASPARYGPDWLVCPSWLKAGMPPMFTDASCGARCAHLKF